MSLQRKYFNVNGRAATRARRIRIHKRTHLKRFLVSKDPSAVKLKGKEKKAAIKLYIALRHVEKSHDVSV